MSSDASSRVLTQALLLQEVLLILEECWNNSPELQNVPIYQASGLARRAISVYQTYIEMMNDDIKAAFQVCFQCAPVMPVLDSLCMCTASSSVLLHCEFSNKAHKNLWASWIASGLSCAPAHVLDSLQIVTSNHVSLHAGVQSLHVQACHSPEVFTAPG